MARFYQTSDTNYLDYDLAATTRRPSGSSVNSLFGDINAIPEDRPRLNEILQGYEQEINDISNFMRANPRASDAIQPRIRDLRGRIQRDLTTGELAAIQDRYTRYGSIEKSTMDTLEGNPGLQTAALDQVTVEPLNFDPATGKYGRILGPDVVTPFRTEDVNSWIKTQTGLIEEDFMSKISNQEQLDQYTNLYERGELYGVLKEDVIKQLVGSITPEMLASASQERTLRGDTSVDERSFYDPQTGELNLDTYYGRLINATADNVARQTIDSQFIRNTDQAGLARLRSGLRVNEGRRRSAIDGEWLADQLVSIRDNTDADVQEFQDLFVGRKLPDGSVITGLDAGVGGRVNAIVVNSVPMRDSKGDVMYGYNGAPVYDSAGNQVSGRSAGQVYDGNGRALTTMDGKPVKLEPLTESRTSYRTVDLNLVENVLGQNVANDVKEALIERGEYDQQNSDLRGVQRDVTGQSSDREKPLPPYMRN